MTNRVPEGFKPMLACNDTPDLEKLPYPMLGSAKLDGIRCLHHPELGIVTRDLKPIPNEWIRYKLEDTMPVGLEGELVTFTEAGVLDDFNTIQGNVMRASGTPVHDCVTFDNFMQWDTPALERKRGCRISQRLLYNADEVLAYEAEVLAAGFEGVVLCHPDGLYKWGRSTLPEALNLKLVRKKRDEAVVVGFTELMHNDNEKTEGNLGQAKRSSHKANKRPSGMLGALVVEWRGKKFKIGSGYSKELRKEIWENRETYLGKLVTFEYRGLGSKGAPRFPVFIGFRPELELV